jgi:hypothetical protein
MAGDVARDALTEQSMIATDLLRFLSDAMRRARSWAEQKIVRLC